MVALGAAAIVGVGLVAAFLLKQKDQEKHKARIMQLIQKMTEHGVLMKNPSMTASKLSRFVASGPQALAVTTDFDRTMTGANSVSAHGVIECADVLSSAYCERSKELFDKYYKIECDPNMAMEEKFPFMREWYESNHDATIKEGLQLSMIKTAVAQNVENNSLHMRSGAIDLYGRLQAAGVPLLVFSAGLANVIEEVLEQKCGAIAPTTRVVANRMMFDKSGLLVSYSEPLIHMFNKNAAAVGPVEGPHRPCHLLLGDSMGDLTMCDGADPPPSVLLKVGFLNLHVDKNRERYMDGYDLVIPNDGSMDPVLDILSELGL